MTKRKILTLTLIILFLTSYTNALQDSNITVRNDKGLCFYVEDLDCQFCDNETIALDGVKDHKLVLVNERPYRYCNVVSFNSSEEILTDYMGDPVLIWEYIVFGILFAVFISWIFKPTTKKQGGYRQK